jgi:hypothetical protein
MPERNFPSRFIAVPMGHKFVALLAAVGVAWGGHVWLQRRALQSANAAQLSFDSGAARAIDSGLATVHDPAVVLAQAVLTDSVVEKLCSSAPLATTSITNRLGEFRSRLQLSQSSPTTLDVRYLGPGNTSSEATADTVARAIAQWTFSRSAAPLEPSPAPARTAHESATTTPLAPISPAAPPHLRPNASALTASLRDLDELLSSTKHDLDKIAFSGEGGRRRADPAAWRESDQQRLLKARVAAAERKISQIRSSSAAKDLPGAIAGQLAEIQHAVASILAGGNAGAHGFRNAGIDAARVRRERAQLDDAIATVHRDRLAVEKETSAQGNTSGDTTASTAPSAASSAVDLPPQQTTAQAAPPPATGDLLTNPFTFAGNAAAPAPTPWWPTAAAGLVCGLFYWILAALPSREPGYEEQDMPEPISTGRNLITPATFPEPLQQPEAARRITPQDAPVPSSLAREQDDLERHPRRTSFRFEPAGAEASSAAAVATPQPPAPEDMTAAQDLGSVEEVSPLQPDMMPPDFPAADPVPDPETQPGSLPDAHFLTPGNPTRPTGNPEEIVESPVQWTDNIRKALAQTEIGRRMATNPATNDSAEHDDNGEPHPGRTEGLAG